MKDGALFLIFGGLVFGGYGAYKFFVRSRTESVMEHMYRRSWDDAEAAPNPYVLRNNRNLGLILITIGIGLVGLGLAIGLLFQE